MDISMDISTDILMDISMDILMDISMDIPMDISMDIPMDVSMDASMDIPMYIWARAQGPWSPPPRGMGRGYHWYPWRAPLTSIEGFNKESLLRNSSGLVLVI